MVKEKKNDIWDSMISSVTDKNRNEILEELNKIIEHLESRGEKNLLPKFKNVVEKIKQGV